MKQRIVISLPSERRLKQALRPYSHELGSLVLAWAELHENLAMLFGFAGQFPNHRLAHALFYSLPSDLWQRKMLRECIRVSFEKDEQKSTKTELTWLLDRIDAVADKRNDAIHTPFMMTIGERIRLSPNSMTASPRARKLHNKDLLNEFKWYVDSASALAEHAILLSDALRYGRDMPARPRLPVLGERRKGHGSRNGHTKRRLRKPTVARGTISK